MNALLACVLFCACAMAVAAPGRGDKPSHLPRPTMRPSRHRREDAGWVLKTDQNRDGAVVRAEANKKWDVTKDGKVQAEVHGHWERRYGGPGHGQRDHGVGASIGGTWGK